MESVYSITNLKGYVCEVREMAAKSLCDTHTENLDDYISIDQMINLVKSQCIGFDNNNRPMLDENANESIFESIVVWIHNIGLAKLAAQDLVECAWDDKSNEMIFWPKTQKKEKKPNAKRTKSRRKNMGDKE
jgi:hypothetical protein